MLGPKTELLSKSCACMDSEAAFRVVQLEAELRSSAVYLAKTMPYVQQGLAPPVELDEQVQKLALQRFGFQTNHTSVALYRQLVKGLSEEQRRTVFFLNANDRLFHPEIDAVGFHLNVELVALDCSTMNQKDWYSKAAIVGSQHIFLLASTST